MDCGFSEREHSCVPTERVILNTFSLFLSKIFSDLFMNNIWFLRTDKDGWSKCIDVTKHNQYIYSAHGSCGVKNVVAKYKSKIFPKLAIDRIELLNLVRLIKEKLKSSGDLDVSEPGKTKCDLFISYWVTEMKEGDIVFVRNKKQEVFICKITGYVLENFFNATGSFQRPVEIIQEVKEADLHEDIWKRTKGRSTVVRNANSNIKSLVLKHLIDNALD